MAIEKTQEALAVQHSKVVDVLAGNETLMPDVNAQQLGDLQGALTEANAIPWWRSESMWGIIVSVIAAGVSLTGHSINAGDQAHLVTALSDMANGIAVVAGLYAARARAKTSVAITPQVVPPALGGAKIEP